MPVLTLAPTTSCWQSATKHTGELIAKVADSVGLRHKLQDLFHRRVPQAEGEEIGLKRLAGRRTNALGRPLPLVCVYSQCVSKELCGRTAASCEKSTGPKRGHRSRGRKWRKREARRSRWRKGLQSCAERKRKMLSRRYGLGILDLARHPILARIRRAIPQSRWARQLRTSTLEPRRLRISSLEPRSLRTSTLERLGRCAPR